MRKSRKTMFFITISIAVIIFLGLVTLILSPKTLADTAYDGVILLVSVISIAIAIYSEIELNAESRRVEKMVHEINRMRENLANDVAIDKNARYKLDKIIALDEEIYKKVGGRKKTADLVKDKKQTAQKA
jgi:hypothetical protein